MPPASVPPPVPSVGDAARALLSPVLVKRRTQKRTSPRPAGTALVLIDIVNGFDYPGGEAMRRATLRIVPALVRLTARARGAGVPVIYANDNFARWRSDFRSQVERFCEPDHPSHPIVAPLAPLADDYFVLKPRHSAFHGTPLEILLQSLSVERLVLAGIATDSCVLVTACDAHVLGYDLHVPRDCVASAARGGSDRAIAVIERACGAGVTPAARVRWEVPRGARRSSVLARSMR